MGSQSIDYDSFSREGRSDASQKTVGDGPAPERVRVSRGTAHHFIGGGKDDGWSAKHIGSFQAAVKTHSAGFWRGSLLGLIRFVVTAPVFDDVRFDGSMATRAWWGLVSHGAAVRQWQDYTSQI